LSVRYYNKGAI